MSDFCLGKAMPGMIAFEYNDSRSNENSKIKYNLRIRNVTSTGIM